ncbi:hypothetical protein C0992_001652 [Termitomyces sp. T32_za158]|nr:hypothetical protein C0992_001652 [Termitomyces sp. T32_za158]
MTDDHDLVAGNQSGGWMQRLKDKGKDPSKPIFSTSVSDTPELDTCPLAAPPAVSMTRSEVKRKISADELRAHANSTNPWFVVHGEVYDATTYLNDHPGGPQSITLAAGEDATEDFMAIHSSDAKRKLAEYHIGTLVGQIQEPTASDDSSTSAFLQSNKWKAVTLQTVTDVSKDSKVFRFLLDHEERDLGLPIGQHVYVRLQRKINGRADLGELVQRAYTPISRKDDKGFIDMLVNIITRSVIKNRIYYPTQQFPLGGRMTLGFAELQVDDTIELKGPIGHFVWLGNGMAELHGIPRRVRQIGMICGGSGVTPILQVLRGIFTDTANNDTDAWVLDVNRDIGDILCRDELDELAKAHSSRLSLRYSLTGKSVPQDWTQSIGRLNVKMMNQYLPRPSADGLICICGPPAMERMAKGNLGYDPRFSSLSNLFT